MVSPIKLCQESSSKVAACWDGIIPCHWADLSVWGRRSMGSVFADAFETKKRDVCYGVGGLSPNRLAWFFWGSCSLFFQTKYLQAQSEKKTYQELYTECVFFSRWVVDLGWYVVSLNFVFLFESVGKLKGWRTNFWVAGDREVTTVISSIYPPTQGCQIQSWHFKRLKFGIPEAKHIYPQDPWDDLYIYLHLVVVFW